MKVTRHPALLSGQPAPVVPAWPAAKLRKVVVLLAHGVVGWAYCGLLIAVGRWFLPMDQVLVVHAIGAPVGFALLSYHYFRRFAFTGPLSTAASFLAVVLLLDFLVVAPLIERSFAMFASLLGMWIPLASIFAVSCITGMLIGREHRVSA